MDPITIGMQPLFEKAERENLIFYSRYQGLYFTPKELRDNQKNGRFRWGAANWELRSRTSKIEKLEENVTREQLELDKMKKRLGMV